MVSKTPTDAIIQAKSVRAGVIGEDVRPSGFRRNDAMREAYSSFFFSFSPFRFHPLASMQFWKAFFMASP